MTLSRGFEIVVISLNTDEDSQSIFETLNARGTPLTQADLVKNLVFQKLEAEGADIRKAYEANWRLFDEPFWTSEVRLGRFTLPQVSLFLNHWLVAQTGEEVRTPATFARFKHWLEYENSGPVIDVVRALHARAVDISGRGSPQRAPERAAIDPVALFFYRSLAAGTRAATPLVLWLFDEANGIRASRGRGSTAMVRELGSSPRSPRAHRSRHVPQRRPAHPRSPRGRTRPRSRRALRTLLGAFDSPGNYWPPDTEMERSLHARAGVPNPPPLSSEDGARGDRG